MIEYLKIYIPNTLNIEIPDKLKDHTDVVDIRWYISKIELKNPNMVPIDEFDYWCEIDNKLRIKQDQIDIDDVSIFYEEVGNQLWNEIGDLADLIIDKMNFYQFVETDCIVMKRLDDDENYKNTSY